MAEASNDLALRVLSTTLESTAKVAVEQGGGTLLSLIISSTVASPIASVLAEVVKLLISELFKVTSSIDKKIDVILNEPLATAVTTVTEVLSVQFKSSAEIEQRNHHLGNAFENLKKAYTYAKNLDPTKCTLIRMYMSIVAALIDGGAPFAKLYLSEFKEVITITVRESEGFRKQAEAIEFVDINSEEFQRREVHWATSIQGLEEKMSFWGYEAHKRRRKNELLENAEKLNRHAKALDSFCNFIELIIRDRSNLLPQQPVTVR